MRESLSPGLGTHARPRALCTIARAAARSAARSFARAAALAAALAAVPPAAAQGDAPSPAPSPAAPQVAAPTRGVAPREQPWRADQRAILGVVHRIAAPGTPGTLALWSPDAIPLVLDNADPPSVVAAAAPMGKGRVVLLTHSYLDDRVLSRDDTARFITNAIWWLAGERDTPRVVIVGAPSPAQLKANGIDARALGRDWVEKLADADVLLLATADLDAAQASAVREFVQRGGGLLAGMCPWGTAQVRGEPVDRTPLARLIAPCGIAFTDGYARADRGGFDACTLPTPASNGALAFDALEDFALGRAVPRDSPLAPPQPEEPDAHAGHNHGPPRRIDETQTAVHAATQVVRWMPDWNEVPEAQRTMSRIETLRSTHSRGIVPRPDSPIKRQDGLGRALAAADIAAYLRMKPPTLRAYPGANDYPGEVSRDAPRISKPLALPLAVPRWHSTGLYAPAGELIRVSIPPDAAATGLAVRIGAHTDALWHLDSWQRAPEISLAWPLDAAQTEVVSPFGGLIYIEVPDRMAMEARRSGAAPTLSATIEGAVESPHFKLGSTNPDEWRSRIRTLGAPWAELATDKVILTVPASEVRGLDDPAALMTFWDSLVDAASDLRGISRERPFPHRYVPDVQISAGYMHAGYPIMTHLDASIPMTQLDQMRKGQWGLFHELGHNHQDPMWTFEGTGEVTCNLWSIYLLEKCCKTTWEPSSEGHGNRERRWAEYDADGRPFGKWQSDPFLALQMYEQVKNRFGWEPFTAVFRECDRLPRNQRPKDTQDSINQWMVRLSRACGHSLAPFFDAWGVPITDSARAEVKDLPVWMPKGLTPRDAEAPPATIGRPRRG
jgi:hypothetical protein